MDTFEELTRWVLSQVMQVGRFVAQPVIEQKTGLKVVSEGENFGEIVTDLDLGIGQVLLHGLPQSNALDVNVVGLRRLYPGSFSEEEDSPLRRKALEIYQIDPLDGTGDFKKTYGTDAVMPPTLLVTKLERDSSNVPFRAIGAIILELVHGYAIVSDGSQIGLFEFDEKSVGGVRPIPFEKTVVWTWTSKQQFALNWRPSYPQNVRDERFVAFLQERGLSPKLTRTGGAGMQALQFFRNFLQPTGCTPASVAFGDLEPLDIIFNAQPDWKTWDIDPINVVAKALGVGFPTDIFGRSLEANAAAATMKEMWHRNGCVFTVSVGLQGELEKAVRDFHLAGDPERDLLSINY